MSLEKLKALSTGESTEPAADSLGLGLKWKKNTNEDWHRLEINNARLNQLQLESIAASGGTRENDELPLDGLASHDQKESLDLWETFKNTDIYKRYQYSQEDVLKEIKTISIETGIPETAMLASPESLKKAREIKAYRDKQMKLAAAGIEEYDNEAMYKAYPELKNLSATDSAIALSSIENVRVSRSIMENGRRGLERSSLDGKLKELGRKKMNNGGALSEADQKELAAVRKQMRESGEIISVFDDPLAGIVGATAEQLPRLIKDFSVGSLYGVAAGGITGTGTFMLTKNPALSMKAAQRGFAWGSRIGMASSMFQDMVSGYYLDFSEMKGLDGKQLLTHDESVAAAIVVGAINTGIEFANYDTILGAISGGKGGAIKDVIANYKNHPALMQGLKQYLQVKGKESLEVAAGELNEEGLQQAVERIANHVLTNRVNPNNYYKKETAGEMLASLPGEYIEGVGEAIPATVGMMAGINVGGQIKAVRNMAQYQRLESEQIKGDFQTSALNSLAKEMSSNPKVQELYTKDPEIAKKVIAEQLPEGLKETRVDTEMAMQEENGAAFISELAAQAGISQEELQQTIDNKAELVVPSEIYFQTRSEQGESSSNMDNHISASVDAHSISRRKYYTEELRKNANALINKENQKQEQLLDNLIQTHFPDKGVQQDTATEIIYSNPNSPADGWQQAYKDTNTIINNELMPLVEKMQQEGKQGVTIAEQGERDGRGTRSSNNPLWYRNLYKRLGRTPSNADYKRYAYEVLTNPSAAEEFHATSMQGSSVEETAAIQEEFRAKKEMLDSLNERKQVLENIKDKMQTMNATEIGITKGLSKEGYNVYQQVKNILSTSTNADVVQAARMGAILFARHADRAAEIMRDLGRTKYTAQDYASDYVGGIDINSTADQVGNVNTFHQYGILNAEFEKQKQAIREKYQGTEQWLKAPNGMPSNLSEDQWLTVRTNAFKRWFGNWSFDENVEIKTTDLNKVVTEINGEMFIDNINLKDTKELRNWLKQNLSGKTVTVDADGLLVGFASRKLGDSLKRRNTTNNQQQRSVYGCLESIIKNSVLYDFIKTDGKSKHENIYGQDVYYSAFEYGGKQFYVKIKLDIERNSMDASYKDHKVKEIKIEPITNYTDHLGDNPKVTYTYLGSISTSSILKADHIVKPEFSKVVDENGEPLVMYHGTNTTFESFSNDRNIHFVTPSDKWARDFAHSDYAKNQQPLVMPLYIKAENPFDFENKGHVKKLAITVSLGSLAISQIKKGDWARIEDKTTLQAIKELGFDGIYVKENGVKNLAVFSSEQIKSLDNRGTFNNNDTNIYNQFAGGHNQTKKVQGAINFNQAKAIIHIFKHADQSTFAHELGHLFLRDLKMLAEMDGAPDWVQRDWQTMKQWLNWKDNQTKFTVTQQEKFADAFLGYLRSGQAPTSGLKYVFRQFKQWLSKLYTDFLQLGGEPSYDIKNIMARMIATQEEVDTSIALAKWEEFKRKGGSKFLDDKTSTLYEKWQNQAKEEAYEKALKVAMQDVSNQMQQERQEMLDRERVAYREQLLENNRLFKAEQLAKRTGDIRRVSVFEYEVDEFKAELAANGGSLDGAVDQYMDGFTKQLDAAALDQDSIRKMAETAVSTSKYQELIAALELKAMAELNAKTDKNVDVIIAKIEKILADKKDATNLDALQEALVDSNIKKEIQNLQYSSRWNLKELRLIRELQSDKSNILSNVEKLKKSISDNKKNIRVLRDEAIGTSKEYKDYAYVRLASMPLHQATDYKQWVKKAKEAERIALAALANDKYDDMLSTKRAQLLYQAMATQAEINYQEVHKKITRLTDRFNSIKKAHTKMPAQERYHYHNLLNVFGIEKTKAIKPMTGEGTLGELFSKYGNDFDIWYDGTSDADTPLVPTFISVMGNRGEAYSETGSKITSYNSLTLSEFSELNDTLAMIYTMGRDAFSLKTMTDAAGNSLQIDDVVQEIVAAIKKNVRANKDNDTTSIGDNRSKLQKFNDAMYELHLALSKMETIFNTIDGGEHGVAQKYLMGILEAAYNKEYSLQESAGKELMAAFDLYKGLSAVNNEDGLDISFERYNMYNKKQYKVGTSTITKENLLVLALNWGTEINRKRVMDGHELTEIDVENALANLDARDWEFVHRIWSLMSKHWEDTVKVEEHMTGVGLEKQKAISCKITDLNGNVHEVQGGYYPIVYDFTKDTKLNQRQQDDVAKSGMVSNAILGMRRGHVKSRSTSKVQYKLLFEFSSIGTAIDDVIHNIAYRAAVRDVNRIVNNKAFVNVFASDKYFGVKAHSVLNQWVKDNWAMQRQRANGFEKIMDRLLKNQSMVVLGCRTTTALSNVVNIVPAFKYLLQNTGNYSSAIRHFAVMNRNPKEAVAFAKSKSAMMRDRGAVNDFNVKDALKHSKPSVLPFTDDIMNNSFRLISMTDELVAVPLWNGIYEFTISENETAVKNGKISIEEVEQLAVTMSDKAVRQVFGSNDVKDRAAVQRTTSLMKFFNPFYSYFNVMYNSVAKDVSIAYNTRQKTDVAKAVFSAFMWFVVTGALEELIRYIISTDDDKRKDRRSPFARVAQASLGNAAGTIPLVRDFSQIALKQIFEGNSYGQQMRPSVSMEMFNKAIIATKTAQDLLENRGRKEWIDFGREINQIFNAWYGVPDTLTNGLWTTIQVLDNGNKSFAEYIHAVLFNKKLK